MYYFEYMYDAGIADDVQYNATERIFIGLFRTIQSVYSIFDTGESFSLRYYLRFVIITVLIPSTAT